MFPLDKHFNLFYSNSQGKREQESVFILEYNVTGAFLITLKESDKFRKS